MSPTRRTPPAPSGDDARVLDESAALLYRTPPREFVAVRDARVRELKSQGRRTLAADVERLRRPTVAAWLVNLLVADDPDLPDQLAELAGQLRDAQQQLAGDALRALGRQRQQLVAGLVARARKLAGGSRPPESALTEVESSLRAALADPEVARDVLSGRLLRAADVSGFGPAPAAHSPSAPTAREQARRTTGDRGTRGAQHRAEEEARRGERERQAAEARRAAERKAAEKRLELRRRLRTAEQDLKQAEKDRAAAAAAADRAGKELAAAEREVDRRRAQVAKARARAGGG